MRTFERKKSLFASIRELMLAMEVGAVERWDRNNVNRDTFKTTFNAAKRGLEQEGLGLWMHRYDGEELVVVRVK
jgi:hypothetical protein